jgi:hypothetical protein
MSLPNADRVVIDVRKLRDYALSETHPVGRFKAAFFIGLGFSARDWAELEMQLRQIAWEGTAQIGEHNGYGQKYVVRGTLRGQQGKSAGVVTVWIVLNGESTPRFVTVYPED